MRARARAAAKKLNCITAVLAIRVLSKPLCSSTATSAARSTRASAGAARRVPPQIQAMIETKISAQPTTPASTERRRYSLCAALLPSRRMVGSSGSTISLPAPRPKPKRGLASIASMK